MASEKFLHIDANGFLTEDAASVSTYAGAGSADRLVKTNGSGKIDNSLINFAAFDTVFQVRAAASANITLAAPGAAIGGVTLALGDRVLLFGQTAPEDNGIYVFDTAATPLVRADDYDEDGEVAAGDLIVVTEGTLAERVYILATNNPIVVGTTALSYSPLGTSIIDAGAGLSYSGTTLNVNLASGGGLKFISDDIAVEVNDFAGTGLQDDGADNLEIDFANTATEMGTARAVQASDLSSFGANQGAKILGYDNANTVPYTIATTIQAALDDALTPGIRYTVGAGGVTKAQLCYVSANNTVLPYVDSNSGLSSVARNGIGLAAAAVAAAGVVKVVENNNVLLGVLTGATAGTKYYWNGSGLTTTIPTGLGEYVWAVGVAKNASDLHVKLDFIKRNSLL